MEHAPGDVVERAVDPPDAVLRWASHDDGVADVWLPPAPVPSSPAPAAPLLYLLHGGFWRQEWDRRHLRTMAQALCGLGWAVVAPEYARVGGRHVAAGAADVAWPLLVDDLRTVRRTVPRLLAEVAPGRVASDRPVLVGHSAGGQLALWWALDAGTEAAARPRQVLALAPVADLRAAYADRLGEGAVEALLGPPGDAWASADPAARLRTGELPWRCSIVVVHGHEDDVVPVAHSLALGADVPAVDVRALPGVEHMAVVDPLSPAWAAVRAALPQAVPA